MRAHLTDSSNAQLAAFITQTFGAEEMLRDSHARRTSPVRGHRVDPYRRYGFAGLPLQAHTHLSWAFSDAGEYAMTERHTRSMRGVGAFFARHPVLRGWS